jgi:hypothetical protein
METTGDRSHKSSSEVIWARKQIAASEFAGSVRIASARQCLLLAQSGHGSGADECPLLGVKRTLRKLGPAVPITPDNLPLSELTWVLVRAKCR